ncbi:hypothetical protein EC957_011482 [Mortierella hygrophila]|uniref:Uncharacterized protein n=1 Tax=Mortierella hygrophila TaxID=979708 RepID=A0A9P6K3W3_9FUNG|nr:hypothetical protein EC957_011482 [Mortierella hygrophila]
MSRQQYTEQLRQIVHAPTPEGSDRLSRTRSTPSSSTAPPCTVEPSSTSGLRASSFWIAKETPIAGQRQADLHKELCRLVNNKHNTSWTEAQVKSKITYAKSKYREAAGLNSTGEGPVLHKQEEICPLFVRLHTVLGGSLSANLPPPRQTGGRRQREDPASSDDSEEESSDLESLDDTSDTTSHPDTNASGYHGTLRHNKRRKGETLTTAILNNTVDKMYQLADKQINASDRSNADLRARELAVANQERELAGKLLQIADEASKRAEEARVQLRKELAAERAEFKKEMAAERAELKQGHNELKCD